jgi:outer membrane protein OmpA-like peptidoglycan-associated protein
VFTEYAKAVRSKAPRALLCLTLAAGLTLARDFRPSFAQEVPSVNQIIDQLKPKPRTRGLDTGPRPIGASEENPESPFPESLRNRTARSLTLSERDDLARRAQGMPETDLAEITFEYNSAKLTSAAVPILRNLGKALISPQLKGSTFIIEGHTDAKGSADYNQRLSDRRADAVKQFLIAEYHIPAKDLVPVGYGKRKLKDPNDPFAAENRRVRVVNVAANVANE